ncbi:MAG TPA: AmmeMemoRadiSam system protein B, partial [Candidatus Sumerlaeota bacterium]|nr:AmmeMemoRadiSam system protein B [Candidatus Sumerlaeota bacterium]
MRNTLYIYLASLLMNALFLSIRAEDIHPCSGAGFWFPAGKQELSAAIDGYLNEAKKKETAGSPIALISPHAGYKNAAPVMAAAYR